MVIKGAEYITLDEALNSSISELSTKVKARLLTDQDWVILLLFLHELRITAKEVAPEIVDLTNE